MIDRSGTKYRRLSSSEIAILQGFDPAVIEVDGLTERERIAALGDAVPPPLAKAFVKAIGEQWAWDKKTAVEICAGIGGLAEGAAAAGLEHLLLIDQSPVCGRLLSTNRPWSMERVQVADVREATLEELRGEVGLLSGGPPCQPWSQSGLGLGFEDVRDLFRELPTFVAAVMPEVFLFENVPGLGSIRNRAYLEAVVHRLSQPATGLNYGTLVGIFNTADFGVPQTRERLFILGVRNSPAATAYRCFDRVEASRTHRRRDRAGTGHREWKTVGEAIKHLPDPGGWRRWITS